MDGVGCLSGCSGSTGLAGSLLGQSPDWQQPQAAPLSGTTCLPNPGHTPGPGTHEWLPAFPLHTFNWDEKRIVLYNDWLMIDFTNQTHAQSLWSSTYVHINIYVVAS